MKSCLNCKYAEWKRTQAGKLHPSGDGRCKYPWEMPPLPASMYWSGATPSPNGRHISRRRKFIKHCVYFTRDGA